LLASYFSSVPFVTYVVSDAETDEQLFAFMDDNEPRSKTDTLEAAGLDGLSRHIASVIQNFAIRYDEGSLAFHGRLPSSPISNIDVLDYAKAHPELAEVAHLVKDLYPAAIRRLDDAKVATFLAWKIREAFGSGVLEDFMLMLTQNDLPAGHPVYALQKRLDEHEIAKESAPGSPKAKLKLSDVKILGLTMRAFNLLRQGASNVRRIDPRLDDPFPRIEADEIPAAA
jgi:hypothetical protein